MMMKRQRVIITALVALSAILCMQNFATAVPAGTPLQKQIKVQFASIDQLNQIHSMGLDIWKVYADHIVAAVDYDKVTEIEELGFSVEVISDDAWGVLKPERVKKAAAGEWDAYHTYADIETMLLAMESSGVAKVYDIGDTVEGRDIWAVRISDNPDVNEVEPSILLVGCHHAREWISVEVPLYIAKYLTDNYATNPEIQSLVDNQQIWIVPMLNPDGHEYSRTTNRSQRKNRRDTGSSDPDKWGVDLNRNYDYEWGIDILSSGDPDVSTYRGPSAFSEPETRALRDLFLAHTFRSMITYHSYGGMVAYTWGYTYEYPADRCRDRHMSDIMRDLINEVHGEDYSSEVMMGLTSGDTTDWTYGLFRIPSITMELRPVDGGSNPFELPEDEIVPTCEENLPAALYLIAWNEADLNNDHIVNLEDMSILSSYWLTPDGCDRGDPDDPSVPENDCCECADIFGSGTVDEQDLVILADQWLAQSIIDTTIPSPGTMSFSSPPAATGDSSIAMTATEATDFSGVEYYFDCNSIGCHDSSWQDSRTYEDTGLLPATEYTYTVTARDRSVAHNQTAASAEASATTNAPDTTIPDPCTMTWETEPAATGSSSISMTATTATDDSGVEYFFDCTTDGSHDSGWQGSTIYEDTGLSPATEYTYTVTARDKSVAHNQTATSDSASATTYNENIVLPENGGVLESYTSQYAGYEATKLTNGTTDENGWASALNPVSPQEFVYSFSGGNSATLSDAVVHGGTAEGAYYSKDVEVWISNNNGDDYTEVDSDTLAASDNDSVLLDLGDTLATNVKLVIRNGHRSDYWELAEFVVYGEVIVSP
jgi:murein tripeptide amidase MpaA